MYNDVVIAYFGSGKDPTRLITLVLVEQSECSVDVFKKFHIKYGHCLH